MHDCVQMGESSRPEGSVVCDEVKEGFRDVAASTLSRNGNHFHGTVCPC